MAEIHLIQTIEKMQSSVSGYISNALVLDSNYPDARELITTCNIPNYISFDGKGINLNDIHKQFYSEGDYYGYISKEISNENCGAPYSLIHLAPSNGVFDFSKGITITFYGDCCREIYVKYTFRDTTSDYEVFTVDTPMFHFKPSEYFWDVATSMDIIFTETALPNQFIKVANIKFGEISILNKLKNIELLEEISVLSDDLPINPLNFSTIIEKPVDFKSGIPMALYSNQKYYGTFFLDDWEKVSDNIYQIKASNSVGTLENAEYKKWSLGTEEQLPNHIKDLTGINVNLPQNVRYTAFGNLKPNTCRYALCAYAFALRLMIDGSRSGDINLREIPQNISSVITAADKRIIGNAVYKKKAPVTSAKMEYANNVYTDTTLYSLQLKNNPNTRTLHYFEEPFEVETEKTTGVTIYSTANNYIDFISSAEDVTLNGYKLQYFYNNVNIINNQIPLNTKENTLDFSKLNLRGGIVQENGLVSFLFEDKIADILRYIQSLGTITAKIRLRNERVGDLIQIETAFDGVKTGIITSMNVHFGYEDTADIEVLEWPIG